MIHHVSLTNEVVLKILPLWHYYLSLDKEGNNQHNLHGYSGQNIKISDFTPPPKI